MSTSASEGLPLTVDHYTYKGEAVAYLQQNENKLKVILSSGVPGDEVRAVLGRKRRGSCQGFIKEIIRPSPLRTVPRCRHVPLCGGCAWQEMDYAAQLATKQQWVAKLFSDALSPRTVLHPILGCMDPWRYRNKMEFSFSQDAQGTRYLGLMLRGSRGKVFNLLECHLTSTWFANAVQATRSWWESSSLLAYHPHRNTGSLRTLTLREGRHTGSKMAILTISGQPEFALSRPQMLQWAKALSATAPKDQPISCFIRIQQAIKGQPTQFYEIHLSGPEFLLEELHLDTQANLAPLTLQISPQSFFQPNTLQAEVLYSRALALAKPDPDAHILDLYCGTATIGMAFARCVQQVTAIELNPYAILDAEANCARNQLENIRLLKGDAGEKLAEVLQEGSRPFDLIIVDPPRTGLGPKALQTVLQAHAPRLLYIACNPLTQAEEVKTLLAHGYRLEAIQPVDQFPHTPHLENIALLSRP